MCNIRGDMMDLQADNREPGRETRDAESFEKALRRAAEEPQAAQLGTLRRILSDNAATVMGRRHGFDRIDSVEAFRQAVPTHEYHALRPMIEMQRGSGEAVLSGAAPAVHVPASGAVRRCDRVPLVEQDLKSRTEARAVAHRALARESGFAAGRVLDLSPLAGSPAADLLPGLETVRDMEVRGYVLALATLIHEDVTGIDAGRLEVLDVLQDILDRHAERLLADLRSGEVRVADRLPADLAQAVSEAVRAEPARVAVLEALLAQQGGLSIPKIWPSLVVVAADLTADDTGRPSWLPIRVRIVDTGCELNELRATVAMGLGEDFLPLLTEAYFEFAPAETAHPEAGDFLGVYEIEPGRDYQVFVTTLSGLYRYRLKATARVEGHLGRCPTLRVSRHDLQTRLADRSGLQVSQAIAASTEALRSRFAEIPHFTVLGGARKGSFRLMLERREDIVARADEIADALDRALRRESFAYEIARKEGGEPAVTVGFREQPRGAVAPPASRLACGAA